MFKVNSPEIDRYLHYLDNQQIHATPPSEKISTLFTTTKQLNQEVITLWAEFEKTNNENLLQHIQTSSFRLQSVASKLQNHIALLVQSNAMKEEITQVAVEILFNEVPQTLDYVFATEMQLQELKAQNSTYEMPSIDPIKNSAQTENLSEALDKLATLSALNEKESLFRQVVQTQYEIINVKGDGNCGIRAVIEVPAEIEGIIANQLRGEMVAHMRQYADDYKFFNDLFETANVDEIDAAFDAYCQRMALPGEYIGNQELRALSEVLETPIHVLSCHDPRLDDADHLIPSENQIFGTQFAEEPYNKQPIVIYYDPIWQHYQKLRKI